MIDDSTLEKITKELKIHMKGLGIPSGSADAFAECIIKDLKKSVKGKTIITNIDLNRFIYTAAKKYNKDLAYVYKIHDKIV